jgi:hypothetical protein
MEEPTGGLQTCPLVVAGGGGVGKQALVDRFCRRKRPSVAADDEPLLSHRPVSVAGGRPVVALISCRPLPAPAAVGGEDAAAMLLVYDVGDAASFNAAVAWLGRGCTATHPVVLVGNKSDRTQGERAVTARQGMDAALRGGVPFLETSATAGTNVDAAFCTALALVAAAAAAAATSGDGACAATTAAAGSVEQEMQAALENLGVAPVVAERTVRRLRPASAADGAAVMELAMASQWTEGLNNHAAGADSGESIVRSLRTLGMDESVARRAALKSEGSGWQAMELCLFLAWSDP